jgi:hypothetical protein
VAGTFGPPGRGAICANLFPYLEPEHALSRAHLRSNFLHAYGGLLQTFCRLCKHPSMSYLAGDTSFSNDGTRRRIWLSVTTAFSDGATLPSTVVLRALCEGNPDQGRSDARVPTRLKVDSKELRSAVLTGLYFMQESMPFSNGRSVSLTPCYLMRYHVRPYIQSVSLPFRNMRGAGRVY